MIVSINLLIRWHLDVVMFDRYMMEEQYGWRVAKLCPNALRVLDTEDLQSLRGARHAQVKQNLPVAEADLHTELAQREVASILRSDLSIMISSAEMSLLVEHYKVPESHLAYLPFIFDDAEFGIPNVPFEERADFVSIGNFRHAPNWDAVLCFKTANLAENTKNSYRKRSSGFMALILRRRRLNYMMMIQAS